MFRFVCSLLSIAGGLVILSLRDDKSRWGRVLLILVSVFYITGLLYFPLFSRTSGGGNEVNLVPFYFVMRSFHPRFRIEKTLYLLREHQYFYIISTTKPLEAAILNVFLFTPMGYLLPEWNRKRYSSRRRILLFGFIVSLAIEIIQMLTGLGWFDVDDLLCNLAGCCFGCWLSRKAQFIRQLRRATNE